MKFYYCFSNKLDDDFIHVYLKTSFVLPMNITIYPLKKSSHFNTYII